MSIKEKKSISRSVRMTQTVYDIVDSFEGNGFNEKFQNLVLYCFKEKEKVRKDIKFMHDRANRNEKEYQKRMEQNSRKLESQQGILNKLNSVAYYVDILLKECDIK